MERRFSIVVICAIIAAVLCCCGANTAVLSHQRRLSTEIVPGEGVVILLGGSWEDAVTNESESREEKIESCISSAMTGENPRITIVPAKNFRRALFPGKKFEETPRSKDDLLSNLKDIRSRQEAEKLGIRYVVVVDSVTSFSGQYPVFEFERGLWIIGSSWTRSSLMSATVIDAKKAADAGVISSHSDGSEGFVVPVFFVIPLVPIPWFSRTEAECCSSLGTAVSRFLAEKPGDPAADDRTAAKEYESVRAGADHVSSFDALPEAKSLPYSDDVYRPCFRCHIKGMIDPEYLETGFRDGTQNLHASHVRREDGRNCRACHSVDPKGKILFPFLRTGVPFGESWTLPRPENTAADGGSCQTGCHEPRSYDRSAPVSPPLQGP